MFIIGITGPSGSGKGTFANILSEYGFSHIDTDLIAREVIPEVLYMLIKTFGSDIINKDHTLNRKKLAQKAFVSECETNKLNQIMHPAIMRRVKLKIKEEEKKGVVGIVLDGAALIEANALSLCNISITIWSHDKDRFNRVMKRDKISKEEANIRFKGQKDLSFYFTHTMYHIENTTYENLIIQTKQLMKSLGFNKRRNKMEDLFFKQKNCYDIMNKDDIQNMNTLCKEYMKFLTEAKVERLGVRYTIAEAEKNGYIPFEYGKKYSEGDKIYLNQHNKAVIFAHIGKQNFDDGFQIIAAHLDCPRIDIKLNPLYEKNNFAMLKTHYYGGILKYQWVTIPLMLVGVVYKKDGNKIEFCIGDDKNDPVCCITDLLPHLGKDQAKKSLDTAFTGEDLNILIGSAPDTTTNAEEKVKANILNILNKKYKIKEEDFLTAEISAVPAESAREMGLDKSMILSFGQDDRVCAYPAFSALMNINNPDKTAICILADREEVGSMGNTGLRSAYMSDFLEELCISSKQNFRKAMSNSYAISSDVTAAYDPNYESAYEICNSAMLNKGCAINKFTGAHGKSGSSEADAKFIAMLCSLFQNNKIVYQFGELGKVDQGGGGTVSQFIADRNIEVVDIGIPVLSMHAPYEVTAKSDIYMMYKACHAFYQNK